MLRLTIRYVQAGIPVEVSIEGSQLKPEEAYRHLHYIVARVDAEIDKKLSDCPGKIRSS